MQVLRLVTGFDCRRIAIGIPIFGLSKFGVQQGHHLGSNGRQWQDLQGSHPCWFLFCGNRFASVLLWVKRTVQIIRGIKSFLDQPI